jgi:hypothetical protein
MLLEKEKADFLSMCMKIAEVSGIETDVMILGTEFKGRLYEDELVYIAISDDKRHMEVERKSTQNPIIYIQDENIIRFHGEYIYLMDYIKNLYKNTN